MLQCINQNLRNNMKNLLVFLPLFIVTSTYAQIPVGNEISGLGPYQSYGYSNDLSADGKRVVIGGMYLTHGYFGHVGVFEEVNGFWIQVGNDIIGPSYSCAQGRSVAISDDGKRVAIGASDHDLKRGMVRVYEEIGGIWSQIGNDFIGENPDDFLGYSVSLSSNGKRIVMGTWVNSSSISNYGYAKIYEETNGVWAQLGTKLEGNEVDDKFGNSVSFSSNGNRIAIGALHYALTGQVQVFELNNNTWLRIGNEIDGINSGDNAGWSVSLSHDGTRIAIGAALSWDNGAHSGNVRVYDEIGGAWSQVGNKIVGLNEKDHLGYAVSLSSDGTILAMGAPLTILDSVNLGYTKIFKESGGTWMPYGNDIYGLGAGDLFGASVSLSSDGNRLAIGGPRNNNSRGHVQVFDLSLLMNEQSIQENERFRLSPNPTTGSFFLTFELNKLQTTNVNIINLIGQIVVSKKLGDINNNHVESFDISHLPDGIYTVQATIGKETITRKLVLSTL